MSDIFNISDLSPYHGDEDFDPRSDLSQGGGYDAEHPTFIPMYTPTTLQAPRIHKMRPRLYTIGHKVNSLLFEPSLSICETWLLAQIYVLCMTRNKEEDHGQDGEDTRYKELPKKLQRVDVRPPLEDRRLKDSQHQLQHLPVSGRPAPTGRPVILTEVRRH